MVQIVTFCNLCDFCHYRARTRKARTIRLIRFLIYLLGKFQISLPGSRRLLDQNAPADSLNTTPRRPRSLRSNEWLGRSSLVRPDVWWPTLLAGRNGNGASQTPQRTLGGSGVCVKLVLARHHPRRPLFSERCLSYGRSETARCRPAHLALAICCFDDSELRIKPRGLRRC
ncbi:hypothetical protein PLICRDRAFT_45670 [Plicaturopsis crispa FD-325 SS-3]|uniref:Uncharacterized protein n=1 Tax=Plicaturopsis crispa FD-325 SS-3 TaxID=944288 RepID=A0A0C9T9C8_PLICR|nr:hypothetical protein PLICRDRAFT_45670 [Plicaturopsis crispa FD-325 SS-3]